MKIDANDPKWTAYALGEIMDAQERMEIEKILQESPEMRELVEAIQRTAGVLKENLQSEPALHLTSAQRERIEAKASAGRSWFGFKPVWISVCATAIVLLMVSVLAVRQLDRPKINAPHQQIAAVISRGKTPAPSRALYPSTASNKADKSKAVSESNPKPEAAVPPLPPAEMKAQPFPRQLEETLASASPEGAVGQAESVQALPKESIDVMDLINVMGGVIKAEEPVFANNAQAFAGVQGGKVNIQRDGITVNGIRYDSGISSPARINSAMVEKFKMVLSPVDAEMGRGSGNKHCPGKCNDKSFNTEAYDRINDNPFLDALQNPLSTFSIDVDTASYSNVRRFLNEGKLPPKDAVRIEELVNYFDYDYRSPKDGKPFAANFELTEAPWNPEHRLLRIALKGREIAEGKRPNSNLVFLLDVSGSMADANKLSLAKESMGLLVDKLTESDRVAIVIYASDTRLWLPSTSGDQKEKIRNSIDRLAAAGSTNGASGIQLAYQTAKDSFIHGGVNRVILCTDGDFNVGVTNRGDLTRLIEDKARSGIYLSALGFGMGNLKDATLEMLANKGHGNHAYIDTENEAKKVLVQQINSTLVAIAKDVKIQVEFNPQHVSAYRLIGYEDRLMAKEDFNNDAKEAGVIGAGHAVTALYELVPAGSASSKPGVDPLKYQKPPQVSTSADIHEMVTVKIRSKEPEKDTSVLTEFAVKDSVGKFAKASTDFKFAAAVAAFGMALRDSPYKGNANLESALEWAKEGKGIDRHGYRQEFIRLVHRAFSITD